MLKNQIQLHCCPADKAALVPNSCDLVTMFECLHDMHNPVEVLKQVRGKFSHFSVMLLTFF